MIEINARQRLRALIFHMKPRYFDLTVTDLAAAKQFFESLLDWRFERFPMPYEYYRIQAGPPDEAGIDGGIGKASDSPISGGRPLVNLMMPVANLDERMRKVRELGGMIIEPKIAIPGIGWYSTCAEPGGLMFGLMEADPNAQ